MFLHSQYILNIYAFCGFPKTVFQMCCISRFASIQNKAHFFFFFKTYIRIKYCCGLLFTIDNIQDLFTLATALWEITFYGKTWKTLQMCSLWMIFLLVREKSQMFFYFGMLQQGLALRDGKSSDLNLYTLNNDNKREIWCSFFWNASASLALRDGKSLVIPVTLSNFWCLGFPMHFNRQM